MDSYTQSNIAHLKAEFELQNAAARYALNGLSSGTASHRFITSKMERMGELHDELKKKIGEEKAARFVVKAMNHGTSK